MQIDIDWVFEVFEPVEFLIIAAIVLILAYLALEHKDIVYAAFFFGIMASLVAGFFLLLDAPFVAGMQIAVYTGGISVLIIFAVLLLPRAQDSSLETFPSSQRRMLGILVASVVVAFSGALALIFPWGDYTFDEVVRPDLAQSLEALAAWLWGSHGIYIQIVALIMLTSIVGSIAILKMEKAERLEPLIAEFGIEAAPEEPVEEPVEEAADEIEEPSSTEVDEE
ncbi:MAG: NADH-quinone oxidoreductase subunit J family protein [Candidatus Thorarchaeota archaeon]|jgi:NADH:ubiquinone oxidoreductase subunit 6 (subunit J)